MVKLSHYKLWRLREGMEYSASVLTLAFGTTRMAELSALRSGRYSFLFEAEWTSGLLNADQTNSSLQNFRGPAGNWIRNLPSCGAVPQPTVVPPTPPCVQRYFVRVVPFGSEDEQAAADVYLGSTWFRSCLGYW